MRLIAQTAALACCLFVFAATLILWSATGQAVLTKYRDPARAERGPGDGQDDLAALFEEAGAGGERLPEIPNRFEFGLLPSGADKHILSVATVGGPALLAAVITAVFIKIDRRRR